MHATCLRIAALAALLAPAGAYAQQGETPKPRQSPRDWAFHLQFGGYYPQVDESAGLTDTPFQRVFGDSNRVLAGRAKFCVYAAATTSGATKSRFVSVVTAPVATLIRKFCRASLTTRSRSATGLKSMPKFVPLSAMNGSVVSAASAVSAAS